MSKNIEVGLVFKADGGNLTASINSIKEQISNLNKTLKDMAEASSGAGDATKKFKTDAKESGKEIKKLAEENKNLKISVNLIKKQISKLNETLKNTKKVTVSAGRATKKFGTNAEKVSKQTEKLTKKTRKLKSSFGALKTALLGLGLGVLIRDTSRVALAQDRFNRAMIFGVGSARKAAFEMKFLRHSSEELGLVFQEQAKNHAALTAAAQGSGVAARGVREIFLGLSEAGNVLGLSQMQVNRTFTAVTQIFSKGKVQAEELRNQMGEHIPGAFQIAAKAMNMTAAELDKALEKGEVYAGEFLPKFAAELRRSFGPHLTAAMASSQAQLNRLFQDILDAKAAFGTGFLEAVTEDIGDFRGVLKKLVEDGSLKAIGTGLGDIMHFAGENIGVIKSLTFGFIAYKTSLIGISLAAAAYTQIQRTQIYTQKGLNLAMKANPIGLIAVGIGLLITAYQLLKSENKKLLAVENLRRKHNKENLDWSADMALATNKEAKALLNKRMQKNASILEEFEFQRRAAVYLREVAQAKADKKNKNNYRVFRGKDGTVIRKVRTRAATARISDSHKKDIDLIDKEIKRISFSMKVAKEEFDLQIKSNNVKTHKKEAKGLAKAYLDITASLNPAIAKEREYAKISLKLKDLLKAKKLSTKEYLDLMGRANDKYYPKAAALLGEINIKRQQVLRTLKLSEAQQRTAAALADVINKARSKGIILTTEEIAAERQRIALYQKKISAIEREKQAKLDALEKIKQADELAAENMQKHISETFDQLLQGNLSGVKGFWQAYKDIGRKSLAETWAKSSFLKGIGSPNDTGGGIMGYLFGSENGGPKNKDGKGTAQIGLLSKAMNKVGKALGFTEKSLGNLSSIFGKGLKGAGQGSMLADMLGIKGTGKSIVTGMGAGFQVGGIYGAIAGGIIGFFTSLFSKTPEAKVSVSGGAGGVKTGSVQKRGKGDEKGAQSLAKAVSTYFNAIAAITGGRFSGSLGNIGIRKDKFIFEQNGRKRQEFKTAEEAISALLKSALNNGKIDLSDTFKTILRSSIDKGSQAVMENLKFGKIYDQITAKPMGDTEKNLRALAKTFKDVARKAKELGLNASKVGDAFEREITRLRTDFDKKIGLGILGFTSPLQAQLKQQYAAQVKRLKEARALGANLVEVEKLNLLERAKLIKDFAKTAGRTLISLNSDIANFIHGTKAGSGSQKTKSEQLNYAKERFNNLLGKARGGDQDALSKIVNAASELRDLNRDVHASSAIFFNLENSIIKTLNSLKAQLGGADSLKKYDVPKATIKEVFPDLAGGIDQMNKTVSDGNNLTAKLLTEIRDLIGGSGGNKKYGEGRNEIPDYKKYYSGGGGRFGGFSNARKQMV